MNLPFAGTSRKRDRDSLDRYYTPDDLAVALVGILPDLAPGSVVEPSVGGGAFVRATRARWPGSYVVGIDLDPEAAGLAESDDAIIGDFADLDRSAPACLVVGNPPYRGAEGHIRKALEIAPSVAMLLRTSILHTRGRIALWQDHPPSCIWHLCERPSFTGGGTDSAEYVWILWQRAHVGPTVSRWVSWRGDAVEVWP